MFWLAQTCSGDGDIAGRSNGANSKTAGYYPAGLQGG